MECFQLSERSPETRKKQSNAKLGKAPWNKGSKGLYSSSVATRLKMSASMKGKYTGRKASPETREKLSRSHRGLRYPTICKENHWNWQGGITSENDAARKSAIYKKWRKDVFDRDDYTCAVCGTRGGMLHADHIIPFCKDKEKRYTLSNGRTLCIDCHRKTETYGGKVIRWQETKKEIAYG
jgi:hypothetical protein